jgi:hypothetical protein
MKKAFFIIVALLIMLAPACKQHPATKVGRTYSSASVKTFVANITITYTPGTTPPNVTIKDEYPDPDDNSKKREHLRLKWKDKVRWHINYEIRGAATPDTAVVTISDFQREFPPGSADHPFRNPDPVVLTVRQGDSAEEIRESRDRNNHDPRSGHSTFKYSITVRIAGLPEIKIDPRVVLDS